MQTVEPLAHARGLEVELREELGEQRQFGEGADLLHLLLNTNAVVCGHAGISDVVTGLSQKKAETFVLDADGRVEKRFRV